MVVQRVHNGRQVLQRELPVAVGAEDQSTSRRLKTRPQRPSVPQIRRVRNYPNPRVGLRNRACNCCRLISRAVIDDDDFKVIGNARQVLQCVTNDLLHVLRFIVAGKKDAD